MGDLHVTVNLPFSYSRFMLRVVLQLLHVPEQPQLQYCPFLICFIFRLITHPAYTRMSAAMMYVAIFASYPNIRVPIRNTRVAAIHASIS